MFGFLKREKAVPKARPFEDETLLETRQSAAKREFVWASVLFAFMFLTVAGLGSTFIIRDLGNKEVLKMLHGYSTELEELLSKMPKTEIVKGFRQQKVVTTQINEFLVGKQAFDSIQLYDEKGNLIGQQDRPTEGEVTFGEPSSLKPGQQRTESTNRIPIEVAIPIAPGKMGKAVLSVSEDVVRRQASSFRQELAAKLIIMIVVILLMVGLAYLYVLRVLTMTRRIEAEFQDQKRLSYLGLVSSGLAHEIKNPLNSIQMNLQLLEEEIHSGASADQVTTWIHPIQKEIRRLEQLVNDFLLYARPMKPTFERTDLRAVLESLTALVAGEARAKQIAVRVEAPDDLPPVLTDEGLLRTALLNLVLNAIQSSAGPSEVVVRAFAEGGSVTIEVDDEGGGIPADQREKVFELFFTTKPSGSGLGLPNARRIVERLGGSLGLADKEGAGACFRAVLPVEGASA